MRGLLAQFLAPPACFLVAVVVGSATGNTLAGFVVGGIASLGIALLLARHASRRLRLVPRVADWEDAAARSAIAETGDYDDIGLALRQVARLAQSSAERHAADAGALEQQTMVLNRMNDGLMRVAADGRITWSNVAAGTLFGGRNPIGRSFIGVTRDHELDQAVRRCLETAEEQNHTFEIAGEGRLVSGVIIRLNTRPPEALVVLRDITEVSRLQSLRRDFVANVSHELRTPLSTIKILTETLIELRHEDQEAVEYLEKIDSEVDSMTTLVRDLLDLARLESAGGRLSFRPLDAVQLISDVAARMMPLAERHGVSLMVAASEDEQIVADERRLHQALINLATNAINHTPGGGAVELTTERQDDCFTFIVRDTGAGIAPDDLPRIWERFFKGDRARTSPGTGLGLAIVKHIAQIHDGTVAATSALGQGSEFRLTIPSGTGTGSQTRVAESPPPE